LLIIYFGLQGVFSQLRHVPVSFELDTVMKEAVSNRQQKI
jgi:hypothetical protein